MVVAGHKTDTRHVRPDSGLPKYVYHPELDDGGRLRALLKGIGGLLRQTTPPTARDEVRLFKAMHVCAHKARLVRGKRTALTARAKWWIKRRNLIRDHLITVNLGLGYEMLRRTRFTNVDEDELLSEGFRALCDAVEAFDPWRGYRYSTYACNAIYRGFLRLSKMEARRSSIIRFGLDATLHAGILEPTLARWDDKVYAERLCRVIQDNSADLTTLERYVLDMRFPNESDRKRQTLETIGKKIRVSKERVRQIQVLALEKLRMTLVAEPSLQ